MPSPTQKQVVRVSCALAAVLSTGLAVGCTGALEAPRDHGSTPCAVAHTSQPVAPQNRARATLRISTVPTASALLHGGWQLEDSAEKFRRFVFMGKEATLEDVRAVDARGPIALEESTSPEGRVYTLARPFEGRGELYYTVRMPTEDPAAARVGAASEDHSIAEPTALRFVGREALLLPETNKPGAFPVTITVAAGEAEGASSFGWGATQMLEETPEALRAATWVSGAIGHADFRAADGSDFAAWDGYTTFDPRWAAAETASVRALTDEFVGLVPGETRKATSMLILPEHRTGSEFAVRLGVRGLIVSIDPRAPWASPIRIRVAQALLQRHMGGALWIGDRDHEATGYFFSEGFSRAAAQMILQDGGTLEPDDAAQATNSLLAALDVDAGKSDHDAQALRVRKDTATGALAALVLDYRLRKGAKPSSLRKFVRALFALAEASKRDTLSREEFDATVRASIPKEAESILGPLAKGDAPSLPSDLLGPCYRLKSGPIASFELGFEVRTAGEKTVIESVLPGTRAASAGLVRGDEILSLDYIDGRADAPVRMALEAPNAPKKVSFLPKGKSHAGRWFERTHAEHTVACP